MSPLFIQASQATSILLPHNLLQQSQFFHGLAQSGVETLWALRLPDLPNEGAPVANETLGRDVFFVSADGQNFYQTLLSLKQDARHENARSERRTLLTQTPGLGSIVVDWRTENLGIVQSDPKDPSKLLTFTLQPCSSMEGIRLYLAPSQEAPALEEPVQEWWRAHGEVFSTLLIVEDEEPVRRVYKRFLPRRGFRTIEFAATFQEGLEVLKARPDIRVVLSDYNLDNGMTGVDLALKTLLQRPELQFLFASGRIEDVQHHLLEAGLQRFLALEKPVEIAEIEANLRQLFSSTPSGF